MRAKYIIALALFLSAVAVAQAVVVHPLLSLNGSFIYSGFSFGNSGFGTGRF